MGACLHNGLGGRLSLLILVRQGSMIWATCYFPPDPRRRVENLDEDSIASDIPLTSSHLPLPTAREQLGKPTMSNLATVAPPTALCLATPFNIPSRKKQELLGCESLPRHAEETMIDAGGLWTSIRSASETPTSLDHITKFKST